MAIFFRLIGLLALLLGGCDGSVHRLPEIVSSDIAAAQGALATDTLTTTARRLSLRQASKRLRRTIARVHEAGVEQARDLPALGEGAQFRWRAKIGQKGVDLGARLHRQQGVMQVVTGGRGRHACSTML